ncbi:hypothetical protein DP939_25110 [Spongiactinospora rosea]|uniref:Uncharacterized protein n=1 Tax=Spongiactinospora rosea TaxID=2248750 RepID=A0A366LV49_9ACTN|nr:hypothetical protein [Spongiactinospora rosea]RBQ17229.1 hypothetical protein DP939_25110 [Spongiactinospora rosea]
MTTTVLAVASLWPTEALVAECDPAGGTIVPGMLGGNVPDTANIADLAADPGSVGEQAVAVDGAAGHWLVLPGLPDPRFAVGMDAAWGPIGQALAECGLDVVADLGRIGGRDVAYPLLAAADLLVLVMRPTLRQVAAALPRLEVVRRSIGDQLPIAVAVIGYGSYSHRHIARVLECEVLGVVPEDPRTARVLSEGAPAGRWYRNAPLRQGAHRLGKAIRRRTVPATPSTSFAGPPPSARTAPALALKTPGSGRTLQAASADGGPSPGPASGRMTNRAGRSETTTAKARLRPYTSSGRRETR